MAGWKKGLPGVAAALAVGSGVALTSSLTSGVDPAPDPAHPVTGPMRTLVVSASMPGLSEPGLLLHGQLRSGPMPTREIGAQVLTDEECGPDANGISRCRNVLRLADGRTLVVRHPHDVRQVPCLTPGEGVLVRPAPA